MHTQGLINGVAKSWPQHDPATFKQVEESLLSYGRRLYSKFFVHLIMPPSNLSIGIAEQQARALPGTECIINNATPSNAPSVNISVPLPKPPASAAPATNNTPAEVPGSATVAESTPQALPIAMPQPRITSTPSQPPQPSLPPRTSSNTSNAPSGPSSQHPQRSPSSPVVESVPPSVVSPSQSQPRLTSPPPSEPEHQDNAPQLPARTEPPSRTSSTQIQPTRRTPASSTATTPL